MTYFNGQLAFISGGSSGIGLATARLLASKDCNIVLFARDNTKLEKACNLLRKEQGPDHQKIFSIPMDVGDHTDVKAKIKIAVEKYGVPDILINSAGIGLADHFENIGHDAFSQMMQINVIGTRNVIFELLPYMKKAGGQIVNLSSVAGLMGMFGYTAYGTSKYALVGFSECLRSELKPYNITVTLVCPPEVDTPFVEEENKIIPPESRAIKNLAGLLKPEKVAKSIINGLEKKKALVIPGLMAKLLYLNHRLTNGHLTRITSDIIVKWVSGRPNR